MDAKKLSQERFGKYAARYVRSASHAGGPDLERIVELAGENPDWNALDIATGGGHTALAIAPHVAHVIATDLTEAMLAAARDFLGSRGVRNVDFRLADAEDLPFADLSFDLVTCRTAAHHFPQPERFVAEVVRVLRGGGLFLLQDQVVPDDPEAAAYITAFERRRDPSHQRALTEGEWERLLVTTGLVIETVDRFEKRHRLDRWLDDQGGSARDRAELVQLLSQAPQPVREWMRPTGFPGPEAAFTTHHCLFSARKPRP